MTAPRLMFSLATLLAAAGALAAEPRPYHADYQAYAFGQQVGEATRRLEHDGDIWRLSLNSTASLLFVSDRREEVSELHYDGHGWQSLRYRYREKNTKSREGEQAFDWTKKTASGNKEGRPWQLPLDGIAFDQAGYQLQLGQDLAAGKTDFSYTLIHRGKLKHYHFERKGTETLDTPAGKLDTIRLEKPAATPDDESTIIWFAPKLDYVPVRIQHLSGGKPQAELRLTAFTSE